MKFSNEHLNKMANGQSVQPITGREGVDFFLAQRDADIARWDAQKASMVFVSDEALIACKMIQSDLATTQTEILAEIIPSAEEEEQG